ncbi:MAG: mercury resistance system transport protein MerF [Paracoccaceae bacterium]
MKSRLLGLGLSGAIISAICCFTSVLPAVLTAVGLSGLISVIYTDQVLLPVLAAFLILTGYSLWRQRKQK